MGALDEGSPLFGDILHGRWESALPQLAGVDLPGSLACDLYEQVRDIILETEIVKKRIVHLISPSLICPFSPVNLKLLQIFHLFT